MKNSDTLDRKKRALEEAKSDLRRQGLEVNGAIVTPESYFRDCLSFLKLAPFL